MPEIARTIDRLHVEGARAHASHMTRHGWRTPHLSDVLARRFWTIALEGYAVGRSVAAMSNTVREALGELAEARSLGATAARALHLVSTSGHPPTNDVRCPMSVVGAAQIHRLIWERLE